MRAFVYTEVNHSPRGMITNGPITIIQIFKKIEENEEKMVPHNWFGINLKIENFMCISIFSKLLCFRRRFLYLDSALTSSLEGQISFGSNYIYSTYCTVECKEGKISVNL